MPASQRSAAGPSSPRPRLGDLFLRPEVSYDLVVDDAQSELVYRDRTTTTKQPHLRELDALTASLRLRDAVCLVGAPKPSPGRETARFRVTYTLDDGAPS